MRCALPLNSSLVKFVELRFACKPKEADKNSIYLAKWATHT